MYWTGAGSGGVACPGMDMFMRYGGFGHSKGLLDNGWIDGSINCKTCEVQIEGHSSGWWYKKGASNYSVASGYSSYSSILRISWSGSGNSLTASIQAPSVTWFNGDKSTSIKLKIWNAFTNNLGTNKPVTNWGYVTLYPPSGIGGSSLVV